MFPNHKLSNLNQRFIQGDGRTIKAYSNILFSFLIKGFDCIAQLLLVPITLGYLNSFEYGIWLTINSILIWINSFDIGLGNGLRNQLAIAVANNDYDVAQSLVSTAFLMIAGIMFLIFALGSVIVLNVDWYYILGTSMSVVPNLRKIVYISFALFCVNFMAKFVGNVYLAMQMPAVDNLLISFGHILSLVLIFVLTKFTTGSLLSVAIVFSLSPIIIYFIAYPITFLKVYPFLKPRLAYFKQEHLKKLFDTGVLFFFLQMSGLVLFAMSNVLISKMFGPEQVTPYNVSYKVFSLLIMVMGVISSPMWSATTDAYEKGDLGWIVLQHHRLQRVIFIMFIGICMVLVLSPLIYKIWLGNRVDISFLMSTFMAIYSFVIIWSTTYSNFLNGMGKLKIQMICATINAILFLPLAVLLGRKYGISGIIITMIVLNSIGAIVNTIQFHKILNNTAEGIWIK